MVNKLVIIVVTACSLCLFSINAQVNDLLLNGTNWEGIEYGASAGIESISVDNYKDSLYMYDANLRFNEVEYSIEYGKMGLQTQAGFGLKSNVERVEHNIRNRFNRHVNWFYNPAGTQITSNFKLEEGKKLTFIETFTFKYSSDGEYLLLEVPRCSDNVQFNNGDKKIKFSTKKNNGSIEGLWDFGKYKFLITNKAPNGVDLSGLPINGGKADIGYIFAVSDANIADKRMDKMLYWTEPGYICIRFIADNLVLKLPYQVSRDGKSLFIKLKKDKDYVPKKRTPFDKLYLNTLEDSMLLMDNYLHYKNNTKLQQPSIQQNKQDFLRIVNIAYHNKRNNDSVPLDLIPGHKILYSTIQLSPKQVESLSNGNFQQIDQSIDDGYKKYFVCLNEKGDTVTIQDDYWNLAVRIGEGFESANRGQDGKPHHHSDICSTAFNYALDDQKQAEIEGFIEETKHCYLRSILSQFDVVATNADSMAFARGFFAGVMALDSMTVKDSYEFLDGVKIGYNAVKNNIGKIGFLQVMSIVDCKPADKVPIYMMGFEYGTKGAHEKLEAAYVAGAYYGYSGAKCSWTRKELEDYSAKSLKDK
ncbi:MAG: hypothetical protein IKP37_08365 [Paludibacteraceae bacterium]|nr:hypothetical protein [Paludibacteraceae bacterium]